MRAVHLTWRRLPAALAVALAAAALAAPAAGASTSSLELTGTGRVVHGHAIHIDVEQPGGPSDEATVSLERRRSGQVSSSDFFTEHVHFTGRGDYRAGRVRVSLGARGALAFRFRATGRRRRAGEGSCNLEALHGRRGVLNGHGRLRAGGRFHTVRWTHMRGRLADFYDDSCAWQYTGAHTDLDLTAGDLSLEFSSRNDDRVYATAATPETRGRRWRHEELVTTSLPARALQIDLTRGTGTVAVHGPLLHGDVLVTANPWPVPFDQYGEYGASGPVAGAVVARFPDLGARRFDSAGTGRFFYNCEDECAGL